ncbi:helix-turn-helix domain-containing protein [Microvirga sp. BSC39]|uniref:helix-turn-helix domain-containing protein n=1 Tax=Microvirga sp. BSC39 TaxID=1549810 RepID=UPI0004E900EC|nr:helix-turn-helix domain-containing protein [Microvirga sp. BSC39]KFG66735.1 hypothetical protein JH26_25645 [Microvirga sp. BSC39]
MAGPKLKYQRVEQALREQGGLIAQAAVVLSVQRSTLYRFIANNPELEAVREEATEALLDTAEAHLARAVEAGDMKAIRFFLERKGKHRGYSTRVETTGADGGPVRLGGVEYEVVEPDLHSQDLA